MAGPAAFGLNVDPNIGGLAIAGRIAAIADEAGLEYAGLQDHPYNAGFVDTLSLITWLAARTSRVHLFPNWPTCRSGRRPCWPSRRPRSTCSAAGGSSSAWARARSPTASPGWAGRGAARRSRWPRSARRSTSSRRSGAGEPFGFQGSCYSAPDVQPAPAPAHPIGLWLGVRGPRAVALVGEKADGWSVSAPYVPPERLAELNGIIDDAALAAGL